MHGIWTYIYRCLKCVIHQSLWITINNELIKGQHESLGFESAFKCEEVGKTDWSKSVLDLTSSVHIGMTIVFSSAAR